MKHKRIKFLSLTLSLSLITSLFTGQLALAGETSQPEMSVHLEEDKEEESSAPASSSSKEKEEESSKQESSKQTAENSKKAEEEKKNAQKNTLQQKLDALKKESETIQKSINSTKSEKSKEQETLNSISKKVANAQNQIDVIASQISNLDGNIKQMDEQITTLSEDIKQREESMQKTQSEYDETLDTFKARLYSNYVSGQGNELEMIITSADYSSLLANTEYMKYIAKHDKTIMNDLVTLKLDLQKEKEEIETEKATIETNRVEIVKQKTEQETKRKEAQAIKSDLGKLQNESQAIISGLDSEIKVYMQDMDKVAKESAKIEADIQKLISDNSEKNTEYVGGEFAWPVPGFYKVSMPYMGYAGHTGMDIVGQGTGSIQNASIVAANSGTVIAVIRGSTGYGYYLIIDHGGGRTTLYAHCSSISVEKGQKVTRGQEVARVGSTGNSTGYHLHFEVRINGKAQNPAGYVSK